jgi:hypothetical protein
LLGPTATPADDARCAAHLCAESRKALTDMLALNRARSGPVALTEPLTDRALVIGGERDRMVPAGLVENIANELRWLGVTRAQPAVVPGAPHDAFLMDAYVDAYVELIAPFCARIAVSHQSPIGDARMPQAPVGELGAVELMAIGQEPQRRMNTLPSEGAETEEPTEEPTDARS